jgi:hypothetical protein
MSTVIGRPAGAGPRRQAARVAAVSALALAAAAAPALAPEQVRPVAEAGMSCTNNFHLHWGEQHRVMQEYVNGSYVVKYWWRFTLAGTRQVYLGANSCRI